MKKTSLVSFFVALLFVSCKTAEFGFKCVDINGMVYDFENRPVAGYAIGVGKLQATTDVSGRFVLRKLPSGSYGITGEKTGFEPYSGTIDVRDERQIIYVRIPSARQLLDLADISFGNGDIDEASSLVGRAERCDGRSFECRFYRAIAQFRLNDPVAARTTLDSMIGDGCVDPYVIRFREALGVEP